MRKRDRMEQKTKMCQSHHVVTHRNDTYARATTRAHSQELGSHVARKEGYLARTLVTLIGQGYADSLSTTGSGLREVSALIYSAAHRPKRQE